MPKLENTSDYSIKRSRNKWICLISVLLAAALKAIIAHSVFYGIGSAYGVAILLVSFPLWLAAGLQTIAVIVAIARFQAGRIFLVVIVFISEVLLILCGTPIIIFHGTESLNFILFSMSFVFAVTSACLLVVNKKR